MVIAPNDVYIAAFVARCDVVRHPGQPAVDEPGVHGLLPSPDDSSIRLLVTDDRGYGALATVLPSAQAGLINVFAAAARCSELLDGRPQWRSESPVTAMVCRDLTSVPRLTLQSGLTLHHVRRLAEDASDGVPLPEAAAAAMLADPRIGDPLDTFVAFLRSLPSAVRLLAAVDAEGAVRATSGMGTFGPYASVFFVNTDPAWRGRGVGSAMTAAALRAAQNVGARHACLDSTDQGLRIYRRLGFSPVTRTTRFFGASA